MRLIWEWTRQILRLRLSKILGKKWRKRHTLLLQSKMNKFAHQTNKQLISKICWQYKWWQRVITMSEAQWRTEPEGERSEKDSPGEQRVVERRVLMAWLILSVDIHSKQTSALLIVIKFVILKKKLRVAMGVCSWELVEAKVNRSHEVFACLSCIQIIAKLWWIRYQSLINHLGQTHTDSCVISLIITYNTLWVFGANVYGNVCRK